MAYAPQTFFLLIGQSPSSARAGARTFDLFLLSGEQLVEAVMRVSEGRWGGGGALTPATLGGKSPGSRKRRARQTAARCCLHIQVRVATRPPSVPFLGSLAHPATPQQTADAGGVSWCWSREARAFAPSSNSLRPPIPPEGELMPTRDLRWPFERPCEVVLCFRVRRTNLKPPSSEKLMW